MKNNCTVFSSSQLEELAEYFCGKILVFIICLVHFVLRRLIYHHYPHHKGRFVRKVTGQSKPVVRIISGVLLFQN